MHQRPKSFLPAFLTLIGTIIGAGVFGVPAVLQRTGIVTGSVIFWIVALALLATHLLFAEIISRDKIRSRLPGYAGRILGRWAERVGAVTHSFQLIGANLAYLILGGGFLAVIANRFGIYDGMLFWQCVFWAGGVITVMSGLRIMAEIEADMTWMLLAVMVIMIILAIPQASFDGAPMSNWLQAHTALGVFLFALSGFTVIPEVYEISGKNMRRTRIAITLASLISALLTWLFGVSIALAGNNLDLTSPASLNALFPDGVWWILPFFGFLAVATSFITSAFDLQAMYVYDLKFRRWVSLALTMGVPLLLLFVTRRDFIGTLDTAGGLFGAANGLLVIGAAAAVMDRGPSKPPVWWRVIVPLGVASLFVFTIAQRIAAFGV